MNGTILRNEMAEMTLYSNDFYSQISEVLKSARGKVLQAVNTTMVEAYFDIGRLIVEEEQDGKERAEYGKYILKELSARLTNEFGKGFSEDNLGNMRKFYLSYECEISETLSRKSEKIQTRAIRSEQKEVSIRNEFKLSWSHYLKLMRIEDSQERRFYEIESIKNNWNLRELQRQYDTIGLILCQDKSEAVVRYTLHESNEQIFASKYQTILPSKEKLKELISN